MTTFDLAAQRASVRRVVRSDRGVYEIEMTRDYDYPIEDVWSAWTSAERLRRWLGDPRGELRPGGRVDLAMELDITHIVIQQCEAPNNLSVTWEDSDDSVSEVRLQLEPMGPSRTRLILTHSRIGLELVPIYGPGWEEFLYVLDVFLAGGSKDSVPWDRHGTVLELADEWRRAMATASPNE